MTIAQHARRSPRRSDKVVKRVVGQANAFNRAKERLAVWTKLKSQAQNEGWDDGEVRKRFEEWKSRRGKEGMPVPTETIPRRVAAVAAANSRALCVLPPQPREFKRCATAAEMAEYCRRVDSSPEIVEAPRSAADAKAQALRLHNNLLREELAARKSKEERKKQKKEMKQLEKKMKKAKKKEKKRLKKLAKKEKKEKKRNG